MSGFDSYILNALFVLRSDGLVQIFTAITQFGSTTMIGGIALAVGLYLLARKQIAYFAGLCLSVMGTIVVVFPLKEFVARSRPDTLYQALSEGTFAFPSGHAAFSMALYGFLSYLAWKWFPRQYAIALTVCAAALIGLIGFSRLYLGLHFVSDVAAGYVIGAIFLFLGIRLSERLIRSQIMR